MRLNNHDISTSPRHILPFSMGFCDIEADCFLRDAERLISLEKVEDIELP